MALTLGHDPVQRHALARLQQDQIAGPQGCGRHQDRLAGADQAGLIGGQFDQAADCLARLAARTGLQVAAGQDQRSDDGGCLEPDMARGFGDQPRRQRHDRREQERRPRAKGHKAVHLGRAAQQRRDARGEESPPRTRQNRRRQRHLDQPQRLVADQPVQPVVEGRDRMAAHFQHKDRQGQQRGPQRIGAQGTRLGGVDGGLGLGAACGAGGIAQPRDQVGQMPRTGRGCVADRRRAGGKVHLRLGDVGAGLQGALDARGAGAAGHALDLDPGGGQVGGIARAGQRVLHLRQGRPVQPQMRLARHGVHAWLDHAGQGGQRLGRARGAAPAGDAAQGKVDDVGLGHGHVR